MTGGTSERRIGLVLSGGGIRAMVFHLGVLRYLAEQGALEQVRRISSVSGGSLLVGLVFQQSSLRWPGSEQFLSSTLPSLRASLCASSLQWGAARQLLNPWNWRFLLSRANLLALALRKEWGVTAKMSEVPQEPEWSINGTTAETGRRFRFKPDSIGDYQLGYAHPGSFPLANALAVSAAFPGLVGPLTLATARFTWKKRPTWESPPESAREVEFPFPRLRLYDGGVYDNLGLEPYFDAGLGAPKDEGLFILLSDAGAPLSTGLGHAAVNPWRLKRVADIMSEQSRALRIRSFVAYLRRAPHSGAYVYIGAPSHNTGTPLQHADHPANFPTTLRRIRHAEFDGLAAHGYAAAHSCPR
jgi:NTE family protein